MSTSVPHVSIGTLWSADPSKKLMDGKFVRGHTIFFGCIFVGHNLH